MERAGDFRQDWYVTRRTGGSTARLTSRSKNLTSVIFGGPDLNVLFVTSMRRIAHPMNGKFSRPAAPEPLAGGLWRVTGLGVRGLPEPRYAG